MKTGYQHGWDNGKSELEKLQSLEGTSDNKVTSLSSFNVHVSSNKKQSLIYHIDFPFVNTHFLCG